ncbi:exodeoxyribonuclease VII large subunit [Salana multivorans]|uniref:exodeoxyribonuclease VII large subunit n=1 Tax=Salana multivorans TaxID=120377 RepID=UPI001FE6CAE6|nr:exodeoxyribonuclease VII large subunit [Salana multivorans]
MTASAENPSPLPAGDGPQQLPERALDTTAERPWPLRLLSLKMGEYIDKMAPVWVEGQIVEANRRSGMSFFTLRDTEADMSLSLTAFSSVLDRLPGPLAPGSHVVVHAKPTFYSKRGTLSLQARAIRPVGVGELLARIDQLRRVLAAEGLFDARHKHQLPFLPAKIGLICGREAKAMHDVLVNARERFPEVTFDVRQVAVQGVKAVAEVTRALAALDSDPTVEVIVVTRGGGSVEDLLPFSNESLVRAVAAARTPVVSAIGHETDAPLLDLVADYRASTPTDAAKRIVPDVAIERQQIVLARRRLEAAIRGRVDVEQDRLDALRTRPVLADPTVMVAARENELVHARRTLRLCLGSRLDREHAAVTSLAAHVRALSPASTLDRGYAVLRTASGIVVREPAEVAEDEPVEAIVSGGRLDLRRATARETPTPRTTSSSRTTSSPREAPTPGDASSSDEAPTPGGTSSSDEVPTSRETSAPRPASRLLD